MSNLPKFFTEYLDILMKRCVEYAKVLPDLRKGRFVRIFFYVCSAIS